MLEAASVGPAAVAVGCVGSVAKVGVCRASPERGQGQVPGKMTFGHRAGRGRIPWLRHALCVVQCAAVSARPRVGWRVVVQGGHLCCAV